MTQTSRNIKGLRQHLKLTQDAFGELIGANRAAVAQWEAGNNEPGVFPMSRITFITGLTAEDFFFKSLDFSQININLKGVEKGSDIDKRIKESQAGIPIYEVVATAGQNENTGQLVEKPTERIRATGFDDCTLGMYVYGHSMYPTVENGSVILTKKVSKRIIMFGEVYLVRTADYLMVKRLQKSGVKGHVLCTSDNYEKRSQEFKRFEPFDVPLDEIIDLYLVKGILKKTQT